MKNRVKEISTSTQPTDWHYCSTKDNPPDLLTRGLAIGSLVKNEFWNSGPDWLKRKADVWIPWDSLRAKEVDKIYEAANRKVMPADSENSVLCGYKIRVDAVKPISPESYCSLHKLLKITSIVLRFINNCRKSPLDGKFGFVTADETTDSLKLWLKVAQMEHFPIELNYLKRNATGNGPPLVKQLGLFLDDDDVMRC